LRCCTNTALCPIILLNADDVDAHIPSTSAPFAVLRASICRRYARMLIYTYIYIYIS
jgi:hypothetical protein